ncbi:MAG TPA: SH3 domain-containing protein [Allosphingosinicella sp.]|nr:SH3 domain-containing protein [Allosphingosinicella sp.]
MIRLLAPAACAAALAIPAQPGAAAPAGTPASGCTISGWSIDSDVAGLNVRAGPSVRARSLGRLPPPETIEDTQRYVGFDILESRDGWFRIANAYRWSTDAGAPSRLPSGWISGGYVDFAVQGEIAFAAPDPASAIVATAWEDGDGFHPLRTRRPRECRGEWVRLSVTGRDGRERIGWVRGVCGIQETSCDGAGGDRLRRR